MRGGGDHGFTFPSEIHIHVHSHEPGGALQAVLAALQGTEERIMAKFDTVIQLQQAINTATNQVAANIQVLIDRINATPGDGLDGPQTEAVLAWLEDLKTQQEAMAANSANPIPPPVEPVPIPGS